MKPLQHVSDGASVPMLEELETMEDGSGEDIVTEAMTTIIPPEPTYPDNGAVSALSTAQHWLVVISCTMACMGMLK